MGGARAGSWRIAGWGGAAILLLAPLLGMRLTGEVAWSGFDFALMGALLGTVGLLAELAARRAESGAYRGGAAVALAAGFLLVWINGAVGIIGSEREAANLLPGVVLATALVGAAAARFRPAGLARAMAAAALAQAAVPVVAAASGTAPAALALSPEALVLTALFAAAWVVSAWLFRRAAVAGA